MLTPPLTTRAPVSVVVVSVVAEITTLPPRVDTFATPNPPALTNVNLGEELRNTIFRFTGIDTHELFTNG